MVPGGSRLTLPGQQEAILGPDGRAITNDKGVPLGVDQGESVVSHSLFVIDVNGGVYAEYSSHISRSNACRNDSPPSTQRSYIIEIRIFSV